MSASLPWVSVPTLARTRFLIVELLLVLLAPLHAQPQNLEIYWIDVEGGAATLIVPPSGQSMLIDTGWMLTHVCMANSKIR
jgi:beta-lactamase superfamily II metal-dependent hydrolase